jgi:hypothetical protein
LVTRAVSDTVWPAFALAEPYASVAPPDTIRAVQRPAVAARQLTRMPFFSTVAMRWVEATDALPFGPVSGGFNPATAAFALTIPAPYMSSGPADPASVAVARMRSATAWPRSPSDTSRAATPEACGAACEVPATSTYWPSFQVESTSSPVIGSPEPPGAVTPRGPAALE